MIGAALNILGAAKAAGGFLRRNPKLVLGVALVLLLIAVAAWSRHQGVMAERGRWEARIEAERKAAEVRAAKARATMNTQAQRDAATVARNVETLDHANDGTPDARPSGKLRAFDCERLRRAGATVPGMADLCGPHPASQAPAPR